MHPGILIKLRKAIRNSIFDPGLTIKFFISTKFEQTQKFFGGYKNRKLLFLTQGFITKVYGSNKILKKNANPYFER